MAGLNRTLFEDDLGFALVRDDDSDATVSSDIFSGPCTIYSIKIVNNAAAAVYYKVYDDTNPVVGTTDPDMIVKVPASSTRTLVFQGGLPMVNGFSHATVTTPGTPGTTSPASAATISIVGKSD